MANISREQHSVIADFTGGIVRDSIVRTSNECLQAKNVLINPSGMGFKKRPGSELLSLQSGIDAESDIWGYIFFDIYFSPTYSPIRSVQYWVDYFFDKTERDRIIMCSNKGGNSYGSDLSSLFSSVYGTENYDIDTSIVTGDIFSNSQLASDLSAIFDSEAQLNAKTFHYIDQSIFKYLWIPGE